MLELFREFTVTAANSRFLYSAKRSNVMQRITVTDVTLRESEKNGVMSFKEKIECAKKLDKVHVDVIETEKITNTKTDILFLHTIVPLLKNSMISCKVDYSAESVEMTAKALADAKRFRLHLAVPTSSVQMEYMCGKKPPVVLEMIEELVKKCAEYTDDVEFSALDATRSEPEFLYKAIETALRAGATTVTLCDSAGEMLPEEFGAFVKNVCANTEGIGNANICAECSDSLSMASACMISAITNGAVGIKTSSAGGDMPKLTDAAHILRFKGDSLGICSGLAYTGLEHTVNAGIAVTGAVKAEESTQSGIVLTEKDDINTIAAVIRKMGYDLSEEDIANVYAEFEKIAKKKQVTERELEVIISGAAMQTAPIYKLKEYVINSGNVISASCVMTLVKDGTEESGITVGDGPIDAAFRCIEQIAGRHFELDEFRIQSVTEGREAVGVTVVKLRSGGKLYSGKGVSTDIVESGINAYINALNKICFEEV